METFAPSNEKEDQLARRMVALGVREVDIEESFVHSGGHGGQNVNKTSTCVQLWHRPSGLRVKCQTTRHQGMNRFLARWLLVEKLEEKERVRRAAEVAKAERARRSKRPRSRAAKERILANKSHQSAKKASRRYSDFD
jgi:protein subunit release factor B